ncbi:oxidoreductase family protein [Hymenopellis radicata]|nr:oxidoreductase family protein [Hymenopellis radicata]
MSDTGYAILGAGIFATEAYLPALSSLQGITLKAVYSRSLSTAETFASSPLISSKPAIYHDAPDGAGGLDALLARSDISAVLVILPIPLLPSVVLKALAAGKHVLSEKPVAKDVATGVATIKEYREKYAGNGLVWRVAENFEAEPAFRRVGKLVTDGRLGDITGFRAAVWNFVGKDSKYYKTPWRTVPEYQGGFLLDGGVHTIAAIRTMLPKTPIEHVSSFASLIKSYLLPHDTITVIARGTSTPNTQFQGTLDMTFGFPTKSHPETGYTIIGTQGWVRVTSENNLYTVRSHFLTKDGEEYEEAEEVVQEESCGVAVELKSFFGAITGTDDGLSLGDPKAALLDVAFIQAALESNGVLVDLNALVGL